MLKLFGDPAQPPSLSPQFSPLQPTKAALTVAVRSFSLPNQASPAQPPAQQLPVKIAARKSNAQDPKAGALPLG